MIFMKQYMKNTIIYQVVYVCKSLYIFCVLFTEIDGLLSVAHIILLMTGMMAQISENTTSRESLENLPGRGRAEAAPRFLNFP